MTYRGHVHNGAILLDEPAELLEGEAVDVVRLEEALNHPGDEKNTLYDRLKPFIGMADGMPVDGSVNLDHYLYGAPRK